MFSTWRSSKRNEPSRAESPFFLDGQQVQASATNERVVPMDTHESNGKSSTSEDKHVETTGVLSSTVPAEGVRFRLKARKSGHVIYSRPENEPLVGHYLGPEYTGSGDQIFTLLHGKGEKAGTYAIKSWYCGKVIYSRTTEPYVGNVYGDGIFADNWFKFPPDANDKSSFLIYSPASNTVLFSRTNQNPQFGNYTGGMYEDQLWYFQRV